MGKRNFNSIPAEITAKLKTIESNFVEVGAILKCNSENLSSYSKFGLRIENETIQFEENSIIPPYYLGRYCKYNVNGRSITRKDLPKVIKAMPYELQDWAGHWHTGTYPRLVYQKEIWYPESLSLVFNFIKKVGNDYYVKVTIDRVLDKKDKNFEFSLLYFCNIMQECFGTCDVFDSEMDEEEYVTTLIVDWEIFPAGEVTGEMIYNSIPNSKTKPSKQEFLERYDVIKGTNPIKVIKGQGKFKSYFGVIYENEVTAFENVSWGNALYVIYEDWAEITKMPRSELLRLDPSERKFLRIVHNRNWEIIFKKAIQ